MSCMLTAILLLSLHAILWLKNISLCGHCDWPDELISLSFFTINYKLLLLIKNKWQIILVFFFFKSVTPVVCMIRQDCGKSKKGFLLHQFYCNQVAIRKPKPINKMHLNTTWSPCHNQFIRKNTSNMSKEDEYFANMLNLGIFASFMTFFKLKFVIFHVDS